MNIIKNIRNLAMALFLTGAALFTSVHSVQAGEVGADNRIIIIKICENCIALGYETVCDSCTEVVIYL